MFIIDASDSLNDYIYRKEKAFAKKIMKIAEDNHNNLDAAVVIYSDDVFVKLNFSHKLSLKTFNAIIDNLPYLGNKARPDRALNITVRHVIRPTLAGSRQDVPKIAIQLITTSHLPHDKPLLRLTSIAINERDVSALKFEIGLNAYYNIENFLDEKELVGLLSIGKY